MKKVLFSTAILLFTVTIHAQWIEESNGTDITTTDKVGIGVTPLSNLVVDGGSVDDIIWPLWVQNSRNGLTVSNYGVGIKLKHSHSGELTKWSGIASIQEGAWANLSGLALYADQLERVRIKANGNVGIGTTNPIAQLHIHETSQLGSTINNHKLLTRISGKTNNTFMSNLWLRRDAAGSDWLTARLHDGISVDASYLDPGSNTRTWWERDPYQNIQSWGNASSTYMTIKSGNVGIGTTNPAFKLDINGTVGLLTGEERLYWGSKHSGTNDHRNYLAPRSVDNTTWDWGNEFGFHSFHRAWYFDGNVGIGTTNPDAKLAVNGTIHTKEVKVDLNGWSDFVFYNDYNLASLEEVEKYIAQNNHLPEIPSEAEVLEDGINLGEMNAKLLQKIEELTLYLIEQNKRINTLEEKLANKD